MGQRWESEIREGEYTDGDPVGLLALCFLGLVLVLDKGQNFTWHLGSFIFIPSLSHSHCLYDQGETLGSIQ